jgi:hypothetical protein
VRSNISRYASPKGRSLPISFSILPILAGKVAAHLAGAS